MCWIARSDGCLLLTGARGQKNELTTTAVANSHLSIQAQPRALFVLSVWRSGSSLFYALLNQHSKIGLLYEGDLPHLRWFLWGSFRSGGWREKWEFWNQGPSRHGIAIESLPARVSDVWEATRLVYKAVADRKQAPIWGEKTPHWYNSPFVLARKFPDARFIFLWRDINAVMESIFRAAATERFFRKSGLAERVIIGTEKLRNCCDFLHAEGSAVHEVNYEDLISNTTRSMRDICEFLQVPFEPRIASLEGADRSAVSSGRHHTAVRGNQIIAAQKYGGALSPKMKAKVMRYIGRWKQRTRGRWPQYPVEFPEGTRSPKVLELLRDRAAYHSYVARDRAVEIIYGALPLGLAQGLRAWVRTS
jgi:hypothetical protein